MEARNTKRADGQQHGFEVLAIIPAQGWSDGLPRRNNLDLCGKPLLGCSIEGTLRAKRISRVVVSTGNPKRADVGRSCGAEAPFSRPANMAEEIIKNGHFRFDE